MAVTLDPSIFTKHKVFLTGSTGALGACLLYKLATQIPTKKIFVLIRSSPDVAVDKWRHLMPDHIQEVLQSGKIHFVHGDIRRPNFGLDDYSTTLLRREITLIINAAADITLDSDIADALFTNCLPALELARMASQFPRLKLFIQISTAYVNSFLPDGQIKERIYEIADSDPEDELAAILDSGSSPDTIRFSSSYAHAKYLMERLLLKRYPLLPLMLLRPACFSPAIRQPYASYGPDNSIPMNKFIKFFLALRDPAQIWHSTRGSSTGTNILDEIPVDFVANACLIHAAYKTQGIVHIGCQLHVTQTFDDFLVLYREVIPVEKQLSGITFVQDRSRPQCFLADLVKIGTRDWRFDCDRSKWIKHVNGPLSLNISRQQFFEMHKKRIRTLACIVTRRMEKL